MNAKTYLANNLPQAMGMVRSELGRDAIILSTKRIKLGGLFGLFGRPAVEVTAMVNESDRPRPRQKARAVNVAPVEINGTYNRQKVLHKTVDREQDGQECNTIDFADQLRKVQRSRQGDVVEFEPEREANPLFGLLPECAPVTPTGTGVTTVMLIGPTGGGKTSCAAKLARVLSDRYNQPVLLITTDTRKPFAAHQLRAYGDGLGLAVEVCYTGDEVAAVIAGGDEGFVIVDTPGINHRQSRSVSSLQDMIDSIRPDEIHLVIPCTMASAEADAICRMYSGLDNVRLMFTKIDEASERKVIVTSAKTSGLPVSYISSGQDVPGDMCEAAVQDLLLMIDPGEPKAAVSRG